MGTDKILDELAVFEELLRGQKRVAAAFRHAIDEITLQRATINELENSIDKADLHTSFLMNNIMRLEGEVAALRAEVDRCASL